MRAMSERLLGVGLGFIGLCLGLWHFSSLAAPPDCPTAMASAYSPQGLPRYPRRIDESKAFKSLVDWLTSELIEGRNAPGFLVGLSGTDSIVVFLAAVRAFERVGRPQRVVGIHFSDDVSTPFKDEVLPWLRQQAPHSPVIVDQSIDHHRDGLRWGALLDWSVIVDPSTGRMRSAAEQFWVLGTRNRTEQVLNRYSSISMGVSAQPIIHLWKSEILEICRFLGVPQIALDQSCQADCACGRDELSALNIPEVDALLMAREGELCASYTFQTIPGRLHRELTAYIDDQVRRTKFKREIPYLPEADPVFIHGESHHIVQAGEAFLQGDTEDLRALSKAVPMVIAEGRAAQAAGWVTQGSREARSWLPEALALFNTPGLRMSSRRTMIETLFGWRDLRAVDVRSLAETSARLAYLGFTFPQWRFLTQSDRAGLAIVEHFGMHRQEGRPTDVYDASLPPSDPRRDRWGTGFSWSEGNTYIELRRAYYLISVQQETLPITLLIRNNSHYFGRDRLPEPILVSWGHWTPEQLAQLDEEDIGSRKFSPFLRFAEGPQHSDFKRKLAGLTGALDVFEAFEVRFDRWLMGTGRSHLEAKLNNSDPPISLGIVARGAPSWYPTPVANLAEISSLETNYHLVLMSGQNGDLP